MKVSIITVTWNSEETLAFTIESVARQSHPDIEYIVIDGNSSDNTAGIIRQYSEQIDFFVSEPDGGVYEALNKGIRKATGDIVGVLHADDFFADDDVVSRVVALFDNHPAADIVYANILFVDKADVTKNIRYYSSEYFSPSLFRFGFMPAHPSTYIRRECFEKYGYYREDFRIASDFELLMRLMYIHRLKAVYAKDTWVKMRTGGLSTTGFKSMKKINNEILMACKLNHVYSNHLLVYSKYLIKWWGFFFNRTI